MSLIGRFRRFVFRATLCTAALAGGALFAHGTELQGIGVAAASSATSPPRGALTHGAQKHGAHSWNGRTTGQQRGLNLVDGSPRNPGIDLEWALGDGFRNGAVMTGATPHRLILFTFDDGPDQRTTPLLLDRLDAVGVKAVFFLIGSRMQGHGRREQQQAAIAREIARRGHIVANHTYDHLQLPLLDAEAVTEQVVRTEAAFEQVFGRRPWLIRPPGGARSARIDQLLAERGYTTMLWNLGSGDSQVKTAEQVFQTWRRVLDTRARQDGHRGGIILLHDTHSWSVDAFQLIYAWLMDSNCRLVSRGQELFDIVDDPSFFFRARGNAAPGAEAPPAVPEPEVLASRQTRLRVETRRRCQFAGSL